MERMKGIEVTGEAFLWESNGIADDAIMDLLLLSELDRKLFDDIAEEISACLLQVKQNQE